ncbi:MAG: hypothetical protein HKL79_02450 [Thermoplasmata archaeon]|nr:hypothetical protein [Thermoplasmata archaeon]
MTETPSASSSASRNVDRAAPIVLLDANALVLCARTLFPLDAEVERLVGPARIAVPTSVLHELDDLLQRGTPEAGLARALAGRFASIDSPGRGDDAILELAVERRAFVVTADRALSDRLVNAGLDVLMPRDRDRLVRRAGRARPAGNG